MINKGGKEILNMLEKEQSVETTIESICNHYSANEKVNGILKVVNVDEFGVKRIKLVLIYDIVEFESKYFGFNNFGDKEYIGDVVLLIDKRESLEFGLLSRFNFEKGQPSAYEFLKDCEILYDRTGKYAELQRGLKKSIKKVRSPRTSQLVTRVS